MSDPNNIIHLTDLSEVEREASEWVARLDGGGLDEQGQRELDTWRARSEHHRAALARLAALWSQMDILSELATPEIAAVRPRARASWRRAAAYAAAASIAAVALGLALHRAAPWSDPHPHADVYGAPLGGQQSVALDDGSKILLNTNSHVEVRYTPGRRDVRLLDGEAFFEVAPDKNRPFLVYAGDDVVRAVGTAFAVRLRDGGADLTLTKGSVEVSAFDQPQSTANPAAANLAKAATLRRRRLAVLTATAQQAIQARIDDTHIVNLAPLAPPETSRQLAWREGMLVFSGQTLDEVVQDVERYTSISIEIGDPKLRSVRVAGYFKAGDVNGLLEALQAGFGIRANHVDANRIVLTPA